MKEEKDYKKLYELALERCKKLYNEAKANGYTSDMEDYETIFPELKESEDERIRKALKEYFINSFQNNGVAAIYGVHIKDILAWLEKKKKSKIDEAMHEVEEKAKAFTERHKGESADRLLAEMRGEEPVSEELEENC